MQLWVMLRALAITCACAKLASADVSKEDAARATALFNAGKTAMDAGRIDEACSRFEQSLALDPQIGTRMNLADCRERQNRLVEAYQLYDYSAADAEQLNKSGRLAFAREQLERLGALLVKVTVRVADDSPGLAVTMTSGTGTRDLPPGAWSRVVIVEPGPLAFEATAPDRVPVKLEREGTAGATVDVDIPRLEIVGGPPPPPPPPARPLPRLPFMLGGAGIVLLGVGIVVALSAPDDDNTRLLVGGGIGVAGLAGIGVGTYLYVKWKRSVVVAPTASATSAGVTILGRF